MRYALRSSLASVVCVLSMCAAACGDDASRSASGEGTQGPGVGPAGKSEAGRVNGVSIGIGEVEQIARTQKLQPRVALERLIEQQLLVEEARRRGIDKSDAVGWTTRQAAVQSLLKQEIESISVSEEAVAESYQAQAERFVQPERRKSLHVLVSLDRKQSEARAAEAQKLAGVILAELRAAPDPATAWERYRNVGELEGFTIKAEDIPLAARGDAFAPEYLDGLFSRATTGLVDAPVRTDFGWHVILVTAIQPAETTSLAQAHDTLRKELLAKGRERALETLVAKLTRTYRVERNEPAVEALLRADNETLGITAP